MYSMRFLPCYLLVVLFYFGAAEPPPTHGYGPPSPVEFNSNEVASHEYKSPATDFGNYASFTSGSSSGYTAPNTNYAKPAPSFASNYGGARSGFPSYKSGGGGKNGVSSSYISIVHGPGGAASPSKQRPVAYAGPSKGQPSASYKSSNFAPASFGEGPSGFTSDEISTYFGKGFGAAPSSQYKESGYDFPSRNSGRKQQQQQQQGADYEGGASDEIGSYSSGGPSYATFTGSKPSSYNPSTFSGSSHGGSRGNAYSTSNIHFGSGGKVSGGHGNFHPPSFVGSFKPSSTKTYNRYSSPSGNYQQVSGSGASSSSYGVAPLVGSETAFNSRALKTGYPSEHGGKNANEFSGEDAGSNYFAGFGDGAGFKVQSSYSTG